MARYTLSLCLVAVVAAAAMTAVEGYNTTTTTSAAQAASTTTTTGATASTTTTSAAQASITASTTTTTGATGATTTTAPRRCFGTAANVTWCAMYDWSESACVHNSSQCRWVSGTTTTATSSGATTTTSAAGAGSTTTSGATTATTTTTGATGATTTTSAAGAGSTTTSGATTATTTTTGATGATTTTSAAGAGSTTTSGATTATTICGTDPAHASDVPACHCDLTTSAKCKARFVFNDNNVTVCSAQTGEEITATYPNATVYGDISGESECSGSPSFNASTLCRNPSAFNASSSSWFFGLCSNLHNLPQEATWSNFQGKRRVDAAMCANATQLNLGYYARVCCDDFWSACAPLAPASICKNPADFSPLALYKGNQCGALAVTALTNVAAVDESTCLNQSVSLGADPITLAVATGTISPSCCGGGASACEDYGFNASTVCHNPSAFNIGKHDGCAQLQDLLPHFQGRVRVDAAACADPTQYGTTITTREAVHASALLCCNDGWSACAPLAPASICKNPANFSPQALGGECAKHAVGALDNVAALDESTCRNHSVDVPDTGPMPLAQVLGSLLSQCCGGGTMACADYTPSPTSAPTQPPPRRVETHTLVKQIALKPVAVQGINCTQARALVSLVANATRVRLGLSATQLVTADVKTCSNARRRLLAKEATYDQNITEVVKIVITTLASGEAEVTVTKMSVTGAEIPQDVNMSSIIATSGRENITASASAMYTAKMQESEDAIIAAANTSTTAAALVAEITTIVKENAPGLTEAEKSAITANLTGSFVSYEIVEEVVVVTPAPTPLPTDEPTTPGTTSAPTTSPSFAIDEFLEDGVTRFEPWPALLLVVVTLNLVVLRLGEPV